MSLESFRHWLINFLLKLIFVSRRPIYSRFLIYFLSFVVEGVDNTWLLPDKSRGLWIGNGISSDKKESLTDRLAKSDVVLLWIPGGGFRFDLGGLYHATFIHWLKKMNAKNINCTILLSSYRHCPEYPFPAALEDLSSIQHYLLNDLNVPRNKLIWGADDAGAVIVLDTLYYKIETTQLPHGLLLSSPYIGLDAGGKSWQENNGLDLITEGAVNRMEQAYFPEYDKDINYRTFDDDDDDLPRPSINKIKPLGYLDTIDDNFAKYLPSKILVTVGGKEVLLDDAAWLVKKIRESGGLDVTLLQSPGQVHLSTLLGPPFVQDTSEWNRTLDQWTEFIQRMIVNK
ncbi:Alpha/Beta hydrolase protein [Halteromyces radiatus]|uniref:Alpha/Beta hydrolase protein n=1 Tax=Halteromyces radiatus TaxID=101107 RepID=UPI002220BBC5|nr:Alpha/Beta hydrolase protein [Halteromyces radiatus]KAI8093493.1 Alpha/Beta hydrolase protein [Halteromyces radiatus]